MRSLFTRKSRIAVMALVATSFIGGPALALTLEDIPIACLPQRVKQDQQEACHCPAPAAEFCSNASNMPSFMYNLCCTDTENPPPPPPPESVCTQNGCTTGWHKVMVLENGYGTPMPEYFCDVVPNCDKEVLYGHIPANVRNLILEYHYNYPARVPLQTTLNIFVNGNITPTLGWVCDAHPMSPNWSPGAPNAINPQFWITQLLIETLGEENVCVNPGFVDGNCFNKIGNSASDVGDCVPSEDCLPSGTKVLLEGGKEVAIQDVKIGDKLQSQTSVNTVEEVLIYKTGTRMLYVINNGQFTVTEGHPILTQKGWSTAGKARSAALGDKKNWAGRALKVGDLIIGKDGSTRVTHIAPLDIPDVETYNLKLSGDNTFIANGVVVQGFTSIDVGYDQKTEGKK